VTVTDVTDVSEPAGPVVVETEQRCDICAHAVDAHDPIARRFCAATMTNALSRNCICR
jgi:hypothetical protein